MNIIQDFKDWKNAKKSVRIRQADFQRFKNYMIEDCDLPTWLKNQENERLFHEQGPEMKDLNDGLRILQNVHYMMNFVLQQAIKYRASSCLYRFNGKVGQCINMSEEKSSFRNQRCEGCPHFKYIAHLQLLGTRVAEELQKQEIAKQKLLSNFMFWKQK